MSPFELIEKIPKTITAKVLKAFIEEGVYIDEVLFHTSFLQLEVQHCALAMIDDKELVSLLAYTNAKIFRDEVKRRNCANAFSKSEMAITTIIETPHLDELLQQ